MLLSSEVIPPGEKGQIKASYSTKNRFGLFNKSIKVYSNDPKRPKVVLRMIGEIVTTHPKRPLPDSVFMKPEG